MYRGPLADDHEADAGFLRMSSARVALVLPGGGARSAYQVGVLKAIAGWYPAGSPLPFQVVCGTSAGAINAAVLASKGSDFSDVARGAECSREPHHQRALDGEVQRTRERWQQVAQNIAPVGP